METDLIITAELRNWQRQEFPGDRLAIWGFIYGDTRCRFQDGHWVRTSEVLRIEGDLAITRNSVYKLVGEGK